EGRRAGTGPRMRTKTGRRKGVDGRAVGSAGADHDCSGGGRQARERACWIAGIERRAVCEAVIPLNPRMNECGVVSGYAAPNVQSQLTCLLLPEVIRHVWGMEPETGSRQGRPYVRYVIRYSNPCAAPNWGMSGAGCHPELLARAGYCDGDFKRCICAVPGL